MDRLPHSQEREGEAEQPGVHYSSHATPPPLSRARSAMGLPAGECLAPRKASSLCTLDVPRAEDVSDKKAEHPIRLPQSDDDCDGAQSHSFAGSETESEAATPSQRQTHNICRTSLTPRPSTRSLPDACTEVTGRASASPSPPPLSLSQPVVEFLASVQLQGYAARLWYDLDVHTMQDLTARAPTLDAVATMLGPGASLQQQNELYRGLRRWEREEMRRRKMKAPEDRRRALEEGHARRRTVKLCRSKESACTNKRSTRRGFDQTFSTEESGCDYRNRGSANSTAVSLLPHAANEDSVADACFRLSTLCDDILNHPSSSAPDVLEARSGAQARDGPPPGLTLDEQHGAREDPLPPVPPSLTASATQLMRRLSFRGSKARSRIAARRTRGLSGSGCGDDAARSEAAEEAVPVASTCIPYDVDADAYGDVEAGEAPNRSGTNEDFLRGGAVSSDGREGEVQQGGDHLDDVAVATVKERTFSATCCSASNLAAPSLGMITHESKEASNHDTLTLSSSSGDSRLSSLLYTLCEALPKASETEGSSAAGSRYPRAEAHLPIQGCPVEAIDTTKSEEHRPLFAAEVSSSPQLNAFGTARHVSLGALSTFAEVRLHPALLQAKDVGRERRELSGMQIESESFIATDDEEDRSIRGDSPEAVDGVMHSCRLSSQMQQPSPLSSLGCALPPDVLLGVCAAGAERSSVIDPSQGEALGDTTCLAEGTAGAALSSNSREMCTHTPASALRLCADARARLELTLCRALQEYNAEIVRIRCEHEAESRTEGGNDPQNPRTCTKPVMAVLYPLRKCDEPLFSTGAHAMDGEAEDIRALSHPNLVTWASEKLTAREMMRIGVAAPHTAAKDSRTPLATLTLSCPGAPEGMLGGEVLCTATSTEVSAPTTARPTAVPSSSTEEAVPAVSDAHTHAANMTDVHGSIAATNEEDEALRCESVGRLTVGTQRVRLSCDVRESAAVLNKMETRHLGVNDVREGSTSLLWEVEQAASPAFSDPLEMDYLLRDGDDAKRPLNTSTGSGCTARRAGEAEEDNGVRYDGDDWWESYGINALEFTEHGVTTAGEKSGEAEVRCRAVAYPCGVDTLPSVSRTRPEGSCGAATAAGVTTAVASPLRPSLEVIEVISSADEDNNENCCCQQREQLSRSPAPSPLWCDVGVSSSWDRMTNAELRALCEAHGLPAPPPNAILHGVRETIPALRGCSAPPLTTSTPSASGSSSPEWDAYGLPSDGCGAPSLHRGLFSTSTLPGDLSVHAMTQPQHHTNDTKAGDACGALLPPPQQQQQQNRWRRMVAQERESMMAELQHLAVRLRFRHVVAPFFLHRVRRFSGLPYNGVRLRDVFDARSFLTRDDLQQACQRYKAEAQVEVDRCIVAALVAQAVEAVEEGAQPNRFGGRTVHAVDDPEEKGGDDSLRTFVPGETARSHCLPSLFDQALLREPVNFGAAAAVVQMDFPQISLTRVKQALVASEVVPDLAIAGAPRSPLPVPPLSESTQDQTFGSPLPLMAQAPHEQQGSQASAAFVASPQNNRSGGGTHEFETRSTPLSQAERRRTNARCYFSQRGYLARRRGGLGRSRY